MADAASRRAAVLSSHVAAAAASRAPAAAEEAEEEVEVAVVGAGFSGIIASVRLLEAGVPLSAIRIYERAADVGGCWLRNVYPGAACDVASYAYLPGLDRARFVPSSKFPTQTEIVTYIRHLVVQHGLYPRVRTSCAVRRCAWDAGAGRWRVAAAGARCRARFLVLAFGPLNHPRTPAIPGAERFKGHAMHTARWDEAVDVEGRRVGIIGTGASAVQIVPQIAKVAGHLTVFQRTPVYCLPRGQGPTDPGKARRIAADPTHLAKAKVKAQNAAEAALLSKTYNEKVAAGLRRRIRGIVRDQEVAAQLSPMFTMGCTRFCLSDDYWPCFNRDNVSLVADPRGIKQVTERGLETPDGVHHELDVLVYATGFNTGEFDFEVTGTGGRRLAEDWAGLPQTLLGVVTEGYPNMFTMVGQQSINPLSNIGLVIETQSQYVARVVSHMRREGLGIVEPQGDAVREWVDHCQKEWVASLWAGCDVNNPSGFTKWFDDKGKELPKGSTFTGTWIDYTNRLGDDVRKTLSFK